MRTAYRVLAYLIALEVLVQGMAIAYALAAMGHWVDKDGGTLDKALFDSDNPDFPGVGGFATHGINGTMIIPILVLLFLVISFFAKVPGGVRRALIVFGLIVLQVFLGILSHEVPYLITLHVLNAFAIFMVALMAGRSASVTSDVTVESARTASV
jgi:hypothetical protein